MVRVILLLGGNIGDVEASIERATEIIESRVGRITERSQMVRSEAWGFNESTPQFTNQAIELECSLSPEELLDVTQQTELEVGRERQREQEEKIIRGERYASRRIDIDIIFFGDTSLKSERLELPHPLMQSREFVLIPIVQIAPELRHPTLHKSCKQLLEELKQSI